MRNGPELWGLLLAALGVEGAVIGGGCIRDYALGLAPKDYDIFVPIRRKKELLDISNRITSLGVMGFEDEQEDYHEESSVTGSLIGVMDGELLDYPVNVIGRRSHLQGVEALVDSFDFGCVQAAWSPTVGSVSTTAFVEDILGSTATLRTNATYDLSRCRFERFNQRNPGVLTLVDPYQESFTFA